MAKDLNSVNRVLSSNNIITLYHNARRGEFKGKPNLDVCRNVCDFGRGIYLAPNYNRVNNISKSKKAVIYQVNVHLNKYTLYKFSNIYLFYTYCIIKRLKMQQVVPEIVKDFVRYVDQFEIVSGETIDGRDVFNFLAYFVEGVIDLETLNDYCKLDVLGVQYCIKSQEVLDELEFKLVDNFIANNFVYDVEYSDKLLIQNVGHGVTFEKLIEKVVSIL